MSEPEYPENVTVSREDLLTMLPYAYAQHPAEADRMALARLTQTAEETVRHITPAGGVNLHGTVIGDNQHTDCFSIYQGGDDGTDWDAIHFCDWPALKAAIDKHQSERGGRI